MAKRQNETNDAMKRGQQQLFAEGRSTAHRHGAEEHLRIALSSAVTTSCLLHAGGWAFVQMSTYVLVALLRREDNLLGRCMSQERNVTTIASDDERAVE